MQSQSYGAPTPAEFPRVTQAQQGTRDTERRRILEEELKAVQERLAESAVKKDAVAMERHAADIQALSKELGLRGPVAVATTPEVNEEDARPFGSESPEAFRSAH